VVEGQIRAGNDKFISNEAGTDWGTRFIMKNFATSPESAKAYLQSLGHEVKQYQPAGVLSSLTDPFPFWVRRGPTDSWRPVDPPSGAGGVMEFVRDALDLTVDAVQGTLQSAAGVGIGLATANPVIGMGAALGVGAATDYMKGNAGAMLGIPQQPNAVDSILNAIPGAITSGLPVPPVAGKVFGGVVPKAAPGPLARGAVQLMAKTSGTTPELFRARVARPGFGALAELDVPILRIRKLFERYDAGVERLPWNKEADEIIQAAKAKGVGVDARSLLNRMDDFTLKAVPVVKDTPKTVRLTSTETGTKLSEVGGEAYKPLAGGKGRMGSRGIARGSETKILKESDTTKSTVKTELTDVMKPRTYEGAKAHGRDEELPNLMKTKRLRLQEIIESAAEEGGYAADEANVPPDVYEEMKKVLQDVAEGKGEYANNKVSSVTADVFGKVAKHARLTLEGAMDATGIISSTTKKLYSHNMAKLNQTVENIGKARKAFYRGNTDAAQIKSAEGQIKMMHGDLGGFENFKALRELDRALGSELEPQFRRSGVIHLKPAEMMADIAEEASLGSKYSENFGKLGKPNIVPRFGAQGKPINPIYSSLSTVGGAAYIGHPLVGIGALAAGSPVSQLAIMKSAHAVSEAATRLGMPAFVNVVGRAATSPTGKATLATTFKSIQAGQ
jgi:hypothetical protein